MSFIRLLYCFLLIIPICSCAEIFYWEDAKGQRHYSDRKPPDSKSVPIQTRVNYYAIKRDLCTKIT
ncbi:MAG: DUF4124 domain-containing protein, partial [Methylococcales bacterium]|nr:DUF4124 domain-containing protein [Methylococcales bacterium]